MKLEQLVNELLILESPMNEMANLYPQKTGLPVVIWFGEIGGQHGPRIKVSNFPGKFDQYKCFVLTVSKTPVNQTPESTKVKKSVEDEIKDWIVLNYEDLMVLWKIHETGDGDPEPVFARLKKV